MSYLNLTPNFESGTDEWRIRANTLKANLGSPLELQTEGGGQINLRINGNKELQIHPGGNISTNSPLNYVAQSGQLTATTFIGSSLGTSSAQDLELKTDGTTRLTIKSDGNINFNSTPINNSYEFIFKQANNISIGSTVYLPNVLTPLTTVDSSGVWSVTANGIVVPYNGVYYCEISGYTTGSTTWTQVAPFLDGVGYQNKVLIFGQTSQGWNSSCIIKCSASSAIQFYIQTPSGIGNFYVNIKISILNRFS